MPCEGNFGGSILRFDEVLDHIDICNPTFYYLIWPCFQTLIGPISGSIQWSIPCSIPCSILSSRFQTLMPSSHSNTHLNSNLDVATKEIEPRHRLNALNKRMQMLPLWTNITSYGRIENIMRYRRRYLIWGTGF